MIPILILLLFLSQAALAEIRPFTELWNTFAYYDTNRERKGFSSALGRYQGRLGINLFETPFQIYAVYDGTTSQDENHWNNVIYAGGGVRFKVWDIKIFAESLSSTYLKDIASGEANRRTDVRYGLDLWQEWNLDNPDENLPWGELWSNLSYRSTNFSWTDFNNYLFYFQPKIGRHLGRGAEIYLRSDLTYSGRSDYWLNILDYGVGVRVEPWRRSDIHPLLKKFKIYLEVLGVSYLKDRPADPNNEVSSDVRFGIDFSYGR